MEYKIIPAIASLVSVECEEFPESFGRRTRDYIYLAEGKEVVSGEINNLQFKDLPMLVQSAINKHFGIVFSLPVARRNEYLQSFSNGNIVVVVD